MSTDQLLDEAIAVAAGDWPPFEATLPSNLHLRDKATFFAQQAKPKLMALFPELAAATEQVFLLILAKGIEQSGRVSRHQIERDLGIILPP